MADTTTEQTTATPTPRASRKPVSFATLKRQYVKARGVALDSDKGVAALKSMRQFIRTNRAALIKAGWRDLAKHQHAAPYGDVPAKVARMIVARKIS